MTTETEICILADIFCESTEWRAVKNFTVNGVSCLIMQIIPTFISVQFSRSFVSNSLTLCNPMDCNTPGFPVHHQVLELTQTHVHWVGDAIQPSHPLWSPSPPALSLSQHQGLFQWVSSSDQVAKVWRTFISATVYFLPTMHARHCA